MREKSQSATLDGPAMEWRRPDIRRGTNLRRWISASILGFLLCGCAGPSARRPVEAIVASGMAAETAFKASRSLAQLFPPDYRSVQRVVITMGRRQFTCDGVMEASVEGWHLALVSPLGLVAELREKADGGCEVLQSTPLFRESWTRAFVARDLRRLFIADVSASPKGRLANGSVVLETRAGADGTTVRYTFTPDGAQLESQEIIGGGKCLYHVKVCGYKLFAGYPTAVPWDFDVDAGVYHLKLRIADLIVRSQ
jgi:hypothetical protein